MTIEEAIEIGHVQRMEWDQVRHAWSKLDVPADHPPGIVVHRGLQSNTDNCQAAIANTKDYVQTLTKPEWWDEFMKELNKPWTSWYEPVRIIVNGPATIVFWNDNTKTVIKCMEEDRNDLYTAFCIALAKKLYGSNSKIKRVIDRALPPPMAMEEIGK